MLMYYMYLYAAHFYLFLNIIVYNKHLPNLKRIFIWVSSILLVLSYLLKRILLGGQFDVWVSIRVTFSLFHVFLE